MGWGIAACSFMMEYDVHTVLDMLTLLATAWVVYTLRFKLQDTYQDDQDSIKTYYVVGLSFQNSPAVRLSVQPV